MMSDENLWESGKSLENFIDDMDAGDWQKYIYLVSRFTQMRGTTVV